MELKEWIGPREEDRRPRGAEDEDSAPGHSQSLRTFPAQGFATTALHIDHDGELASEHPPPAAPSSVCRLLLVPSLVPCLEEDISPWGATPVPQDSRGQPGTQGRNRTGITSGLTMVGGADGP